LKNDHVTVPRIDLLDVDHALICGNLLSHCLGLSPPVRPFAGSDSTRKNAD
jgi:hypothetical protein